MTTSVKGLVKLLFTVDGKVFGKVFIYQGICFKWKARRGFCTGL